MLKNINYSKILFFDIETVPLEYNFKNLDERGQGLWDRKTRFIQERENINAEEAYDKAGIYAEFGKVVCISMGFILQKDGETQIRLKSIANKDESFLLQEFIDLFATLDILVVIDEMPVIAHMYLGLLYHYLLKSLRTSMELPMKLLCKLKSFHFQEMGFQESYLLSLFVNQ